MIKGECSVSNPAVLKSVVHRIILHHTLYHCLKIVLFCRAMIERVPVLEARRLHINLRKQATRIANWFISLFICKYNVCRQIKVDK
jgi:hypothetical protein